MSLNLLKASLFALALSVSGSTLSSDLTIRVSSLLPLEFELPLAAYLARLGVYKPQITARSANFAGSAAFFLIQIGTPCIDNICLTLEGKLVDGKIVIESIFYAKRDVSVESMIFPVRGPFPSVATFRVRSGYFTVYRTSGGFEYFALPSVRLHNMMIDIPDGRVSRPTPLDQASNFDAFRKYLERLQ